ncbi:MAG: DUF2723 domain-containing protein [Bacteroidetes bacterium]|nr:DUF2723 domain-containing protein [Bacteroidota bacterium]
MKLLSGLHGSPGAVAVASAVVCLFVYLRTMMPGLGFIDCGELVTVAHSLSIAHPTGYPLFTLLGWMVTHLPFGGEEVQRMNTLAALLTAGSIVFFCSSGRVLIETAARSFSLRRELVLPAAAGGVLLLGFSKTFWTQALSVEVYSLHLFLISIVLRLVLHARERGMPRGWPIAAYALGLSFTNHMTTILLVPGVLYLYLSPGGSGKRSWKGLARLIPPFLLGLSVYLYLPLRASSAPLLNWGNPSSIERFLWHLGGKQYRVWLFASSDAAWKNLSAFVSGLPDEFAVVGLVMALVGLIGLWRASRHVAYGTALLFVVCALYSMNYDIHDIDSYFLLAYCCVGLWAGVGLLIAGSWWVGLSGWKSWLVGILVLGIGGVPLAVHYKEMDKSEHFLVEDYTRNVFSSVAKGGVVLSYQWDYWLSASYYHQYVRGERTDVIVIDKELLRRSWYLEELEGRYPGFMQRCRGEVEAFKREVYKFEHELPYDGAVIESRYVAMIRAMVERSMAHGPVYVTPEVEEGFTAGYMRVPEGLVFRVVADPNYVPAEVPEWVIRPFGGVGRLEAVIWQLYGGAFLARGDYFLRNGGVEEAKKAYRMGLRYDTASPVLRSRLVGPGG